MADDRPTDHDRAAPGSFWSIVDRLTVGALPIAVVLSVAMTAIGRWLLLPGYAAAGLEPGELARLALSWPGLLSTVAIPLAAIGICRAIPSKVVRTVVALVAFHVWLLTFLVVAILMSWPALTAGIHDTGFS